MGCTLRFPTAEHPSRAGKSADNGMGGWAAGSIWRLRCQASPSLGSLILKRYLQICPIILIRGIMAMPPHLLFVTTHWYSSKKSPGNWPLLFKKFTNFALMRSKGIVCLNKQTKYPWRSWKIYWWTQSSHKVWRKARKRHRKMQRRRERRRRSERKMSKRDGKKGKL